MTDPMAIDMILGEFRKGIALYLENFSGQGVVEEYGEAKRLLGLLKDVEGTLRCHIEYLEDEVVRLMGISTLQRVIRSFLVSE
jgi:hypothetical protein